MPESEYEQELLEALDKLVEEKTFSLDAIKKIDDVRSKADLLSSELTVLRGELEKWVETHQERESVLVEREGKITGLEKATAVSQAESALAIKMFETIFKPVTLRREIQRLVARPSDDGYSSTQMPESEDVVETEE